MTAAYGSSQTKRRRRTKDDIFRIKIEMRKLLGAEHPMTVRQVFYRLVSLGVIDKTEAEYKGTVCRLLTEMRLAYTGDDALGFESFMSVPIPYGWIADNTRWMRKPTTYSGVEDALRRTARTYRRSLWDTANCYVEVWLEKDALAGVLVEETDKWDVPLMVTRGYPSLSFVAEAAEAMSEIDRPVYIYYFGDHDPSGVDPPPHRRAAIRADVGL